MLFYFLLKLAYRRFIYSDIRVNDCMDLTNNIIVNKLFERINSAREAQEQAKLLKEKQAADALLIKQKLDNENMAKQRQIQQRNNQYFSTLGNGKTPVSVKASSDWMALFNRKK